MNEKYILQTEYIVEEDDSVSWVLLSTFFSPKKIDHKKSAERFLESAGKFYMGQFFSDERPGEICVGYQRGTPQYDKVTDPEYGVKFYEDFDNIIDKALITKV